jgi:hypothetical protein
MKYVARFAAVLVIGWMAATGSYAGPGGPGGGGQGGHGGSGGHGSGGHGASAGHGGHGGHGGFSSGRGVGHAVGHSLGHFFGRHSKGAGPSRETDIAQHQSPWMVSAGSQRFHHRHINDFPFGDRFLRFHNRHGFGFDGCGGFGFPRRRFFFGDDFNCFGGGFLFDPFFIFDFSESFGPSDSTTAALAAEADAEAAEQDNGAEIVGESSALQEDSRGVLGLPDETKGEQPVTLLQLRDGSMYGLTDYWVDGQQLHYRTTYSGENSIGLDRVDLEKTAQLNADRGVVFELRAKRR